MDLSDQQSFRQRLTAQEPLLGTFLKSPGVQSVEILGDVGFDFVVIDSEHAPWDRRDIDLAILAARSQSLSVLVRVEGVNEVLNALDCGATGVMIPHVCDPEIARDVAAACRYQGGRRGFSNSPRAGGYGALSLGEHLKKSDDSVVVIAMLEDAKALDHATEIAQVDGIDAFFLGRGDLTVAMGETSPQAQTVQSAVGIFVEAVKAAGKPICAFVGKTSEIPALQKLGITMFILSSEQGLLRQAAMAELNQFRSL